MENEKVFYMPFAKVVALMVFIAILTGCNTKEEMYTGNDEINVGNVENENSDTDALNSMQTSKTSNENTMIIWDEITDSGINEEQLLKNVDTVILEKIANSLREAIEEEESEEAANPEILVTEGWTRIFQKKKYKEVIAIGKPAMKPLFLILYKSENNGLYEYLCASALQEVSGITFYDANDGTQGWTTGKEYLELFTQAVLRRQ